MSDTETIAEVLAAHVMVGMKSDGYNRAIRCRECDALTTGEGIQWIDLERIHQAAALEPIIQGREKAAWDACAREADGKWLIGAASAKRLKDTNPYDTKEEA